MADAPAPCRLLRIAPEDNVAVALDGVAPGEMLTVDGRAIEAVDAIPAGHKVAISAIPPGGKVLKYNAPIGSARRAIRPGEHVHSHNLQSDYLP